MLLQFRDLLAAAAAGGRTLVCGHRGARSPAAVESGIITGFPQRMPFLKGKG